MTLALRSRWKLENGTSLGVYATVVEAAVVLVCARLLVRLYFRRVAPWVLAARQPEDARPDGDLEMRIGRSVQAVVRMLRWKDCCLPAAMTVKAMLARRGFASTIHLGAGRKETGTLHAHAWIDAGGEVITGEDYLHRVTAIVRERKVL